MESCLVPGLICFAPTPQRAIFRWAAEGLHLQSGFRLEHLSIKVEANFSKRVVKESSKGRAFRECASDFLMITLSSRSAISLALGGWEIPPSQEAGVSTPLLSLWWPDSARGNGSLRAHCPIPGQQWAKLPPEWSSRTFWCLQARAQ